MEKTVELSILMGLYGAFLTQRQRIMLAQYVDEDFSLSEIAEREGISRQGVRDALKRSEAQLYAMEKSLGLLHRGRRFQKEMGLLMQLLVEAELPEEKRAALIAQAGHVQEIWED